MTLRTDVHLYPLYLKWALDHFRNGESEVGLRIFKFVAEQPISLIGVVYENLMKIKGLSNLILGEKSFLERDGFSSSCREKARAISLVLKTIDQNELTLRLQKVGAMEKRLVSRLNHETRALALCQLHLRRALDHFRMGRTIIGLRVFKVALNKHTSLIDIVYEKLREIKKLSNLDAARNSFLESEGYSSNCWQKARAICLALQGIDQKKLKSANRTTREIEEQYSAAESILRARASAASQYARDSRALTWLNDNEQILLVRKENGGLEYVVFNERTKRTWSKEVDNFTIVTQNDGKAAFINRSSCSSEASSSIDVSSSCTIDSREDCISILRNYVVTVKNESDNELLILEYIPCHNKLSEKEITSPVKLCKLVENQNVFGKQHRFIWRFCEERAKSISWLPVNKLFNEIKHINDRIYPPELEMVAQQENLLERSEVGLSNFKEPFLANFDVSSTRFGMKVDSESLYPKLGEVLLRKIRSQSHMDPKKIIDRDTWAVTLICKLNVESKIVSWVGHTMIVYEGIRNGKHFTNCTHFTNIKGTKVEIFEDAVSMAKRYEYKTETWSIYRISVEIMEKQINEEIRGGGLGYDFLGINNNEHTYNCLTWAIKTLFLAGIILPPRGVLTVSPEQYVRDLSNAPEKVLLRFSAITQLVFSYMGTNSLLSRFSSPFFYERVSSLNQAGEG